MLYRDHPMKARHPAQFRDLAPGTFAALLLALQVVAEKFLCINKPLLPELIRRGLRTVNIVHPEFRQVLPNTRVKAKHWSKPLCSLHVRCVCVSKFACANSLLATVTHKTPACAKKNACAIFERPGATVATTRPRINETVGGPGEQGMQASVATTRSRITVTVGGHRTLSFHHRRSTGGSQAAILLPVWYRTPSDDSRPPKMAASTERCTVPGTLW